MKKILLFLLLSFTGCVPALKAQSTGIQACVINGAGQPGPLANSTNGYVLTILGTNQVGWAPGGGGGSGWSLTGNSGTNPNANWIGTNDAHALNFHVGGSNAGWIDYGSSTANVAFNPGAVSVTGPQNAAIQNTLVGFGVLNGGGVLPSYNTAVGTYTLNNDTGSYNTAIGAISLQQNVSGINNSALGYSALSLNTGGSSNTSIGTNALYNNISSWNTAVGDSAGINNTTGFSNTTVGYASLQSNVTGYDLTSIGDSADVSTDGLYNSTAIGNEAIITASNQIVLGNSNVTSVVMGNGAIISPYTVHLLGSYVLNLNPITDSLIVSVSIIGENTPIIGDDITGSLSSTTATVYNVIGTTVYLINVSSPDGFVNGDIITGSNSGNHCTVLSDGVPPDGAGASFDTNFVFNDNKNHVITDIVLDSSSISLNNVGDLYFNSQKFNGGIRYGAASDLNSNINTSYNCISFPSEGVRIYGEIWISSFYCYFDAVEGTSATCKLKIYGY